MDSYLFCGSDSEETFCIYGVVEPENVARTFSLVGIVGIYELAKAGCVEDVLESILNGGDIDMGLTGACNGGQKELALLMIERGAVRFDGGLAEACFGGHKELAELMIERGAIDFNWGLVEACRNNHKELALLMIQLIESSGDDAYFNWGLIAACYNYHTELAQLMIEKGATECGNCDKPLDEH
jgi:hypothetical protein